MLREMTTMEIMSGGQKLQEHSSPLFPCSAYYTRWSETGLHGVPWHWHRELELMIVKDGSARVFFGDKSALLSAGDGYFCNANTIHSIQMETSPHCSVHSLVFSHEIISGTADTVFFKKYTEPLVSAKNFPGLALYSGNPQHQEILTAIDKAHSACGSEELGYEFMVRNELSRAWLGIFQNSGDLFSAPLGENLTEVNRIKTMLSYIQRNYGDNISVSDLALAANICVRECHRCFDRVLHTSPGSYIQQYRIQMASIMLRDTSMSILEVGLSAGFSNPSHFSKIFRQHMGISPSRYRSGYDKSATGRLC